MRTDPRFNRVRTMMLDQAVPRLENGGIALCHICQRNVYFAGGFLMLLVRNIEHAAFRLKIQRMVAAKKAHRRQP